MRSFVILMTCFCILFPLITHANTVVVKKVTGDSLFKKGKYKKAAEIYKNEVKKAKNKDYYYKQIFVCYKYLKQYKKAIQYIDKAIQFKPTVFSNYMLKIRLLYSLKKYKQMFSFMDRVVKTSKDKNIVYIMLVIKAQAVTFVKKDFKQALSLLKKAIGISPNKPLAYYYVVKFCKMQARKKKKPTYVIKYVRVSIKYLELAEKNKAYHSSLKLELVQAYIILGRALIDMKKSIQGKQALHLAILKAQKALKMYPKISTFYLYIAHAYYSLKQYKKAIAALDKGIKTEKHIWRRFGMIRFRKHILSLLKKKDDPKKPIKSNKK